METILQAAATTLLNFTDYESVEYQQNMSILEDIVKKYERDTKRQQMVIRLMRAREKQSIQRIKQRLEDIKEELLNTVLDPDRLTRMAKLYNITFQDYIVSIN